MMTKYEALKQALEALLKNESHRTLAETRYWCDQYKFLAQQAIEALAQPAQETDRQTLQANGTHPAPCARHCEATAFNIVIRNLEKRLKQPAQEPVAFAVVGEGKFGLYEIGQETETDASVCKYWENRGYNLAPLYITPPQRPWVGLKDDEAIQLAAKVIARLDMPPETKAQLQQHFMQALRAPDSLWMLFAAEIEAALEGKNT